MKNWKKMSSKIKISNIYGFLDTFRREVQLLLALSSEYAVGYGSP